METKVVKHSNFVIRGSQRLGACLTFTFFKPVFFKGCDMASGSGVRDGGGKSHHTWNHTQQDSQIRNVQGRPGITPGCSKL